MKNVVLTLAFASGVFAVGQVGAADALALAKSKNCMACHAIDTKLVGPAYKDVAKKYSKADEEKLIKKVKAGGSGAWGAVPMPPNNITDAEAKTLVEWVLSLK